VYLLASQVSSSVTAEQNRVKRDILGALQQIYVLMSNSVKTGRGQGVGGRGGFGVRLLFADQHSRGDKYVSEWNAHVTEVVQKIQQTFAIDIIRLANLAKRHDRQAACGKTRAQPHSPVHYYVVQQTYSLRIKTCAVRSSLLYLQCDVGVGEVASDGAPLTVCGIWKVKK